MAITAIMVVGRSTIELKGARLVKSMWIFLLSIYYRIERAPASPWIISLGNVDLL